MGKTKYQGNILKLFEKSPVLDFASIERVVKEKKNVKQYAKQLVRNMIRAGKIRQITRGYYTFYDEASLAVFCFKPAYLGLQDSLSFHDLWEQETIPVIITARKARQGIRKVFNSNILIRRIDKKYFFGFNFEKQGKFVFPYSDIEKTFIDMVYFKQKLSEEARNNFKKRIDKKKLKSYLKVYPARFRKKLEFQKVL